jgi:hypothetical protein
MTHDTLLSDPQEIIGRHWSKHPSPERVALLGLARDALDFLLATGQRYRFEDFRKGPMDAASPRVVAAPLQEAHAGLKERLDRTQDFFTKLREEPESVEDRERIQVILDALHFISATGQYSPFAEYLEHVEAGGPPYVVASFATREEAETWLKEHPNPPDSASVLIENAYYSVLYDRDTNTRHLPRTRDLDHYLAELQAEEPPRAIVSFSSLGEAEAWMQSQPAPARRTWVSIAGKLYLAAYHPNISHRALYPLQDQGS